MHYFMNTFKFSLILIIFKCDQTLAKVDVCGNTNAIDLSALDLTNWDLVLSNKENQTVEYDLSICSPFDSKSTHEECNGKHICRYNTITKQTIGYDLFSVNDASYGSNVHSVSAVFNGPVCDENLGLNYSLSIRFTCGPHLEYPQQFLEMNCKTDLIWRTYAVCKEKSVQNEVKCYVYDNKGQRRDLTPLIKPKGGTYKVLSPDQEFYINVCSGVSNQCPENDTGACLGLGSNKYIKVGDYRYNTLEFKGSNGVVPYDHIEMTYKAKSSACTNINANTTFKTTIRFLCPPKDQKNSLAFRDRNPKLVSNLDCDYQIEWWTEYACPVQQIQVSPNACKLREDTHGIDFNLKSLLKRNKNEFYKIENITINNSKTNFNIDFNVCGGIGSKCGDSDWDSIAVCLRSKDNSIKDKVIGMATIGSLRLADNKFLLEYQNKGSDCKLGLNAIPERTVIEFICDDSKGFDFIGKPEFISFEDCIYSIVWKTSLVCPIISANISCITTFKNNTFDLAVLRRNFISEPWIASVSQALPWSKHAKSEKDIIYLNVCGLLPKTVETTACDVRSSACMTVGDSNTTVNLGQFTSSPQFNEDIDAIELIYDNGFDMRTNMKIKSKFTLRCKPGDQNSEPILVDIDEELGIYEFEWGTSAACPINAFFGNNCKVYDEFLDYTFDLSLLKSKSYYPIKAEGYEFQINVCAEVVSPSCNRSNVIKALGPYGGCQVEENEKSGKRVFSLGKANESLAYWNGIINLTLSDGTPYNNPEKTPRKSQISFICDPNINIGVPEYDGERDRSYFFRWYTSLACPQAAKVVHCVWDNGSHILDLTQLAMTSGNHYTVSVPSNSEVPSIYYINVCRPLNPIHDKHMSLKGCGVNSAACKVSLGTDHSVLNLGEATHPPITAFDGSVSLFYESGSICPTNSNKTIGTRIKFECDPHADLTNPIVYEPGSELTDSEECVYLFEWRTSAVCDVIQPTKLDNNLCVYTDPRTGFTVDLSSLKRQPNEEAHKVFISQTQSTFELNVCGLSNSMAASECIKSAVCFTSNKTHSQSVPSVINYGLLTSSAFFYDGINLRIKYFNGSKCSAHSDTGMMSSEIIFKCNPNAKNTSPKLHSSHACIAVFEWETELVCGLELPKCSIVSGNKFYNLRQLSSISHAWNTTDSNGNLYFLNVCTKLPLNINCRDKNAASCKCTHDSNKLICSESLGDPSVDELSVNSDGDLLLTYRSGDEDQCDKGMKAQTQITFKCGQKTGNPKFVEFIKTKCIYKFEWSSIMACPVNTRNDQLLAVDKGYLHDPNIDSYINISPLLSKTFNVNEKRIQNNKTDEYIYVINLKGTQMEDSECSKASVCQTKNDFIRDIGSTESIKYYLRGHELQIILESLSPKKCGKNKNKNVTTIFRLQCSSYSGLGEPVFMYESNDCDYTFVWETELVCVQQFIGKTQFDAITTNAPIDSNIQMSDTTNDKSSHSGVWIGIVIVVFFVVTLGFLLFYKQRVRQSLMFRFRRLFGPETTNHTFHYHQLASHEKDRQTEVVFIDCNDAHNENTIAGQTSRHVPYYMTIYDDSDVDLLT